ncbi:IS481 family transposase [Pseudovibrio sp. Ad37]|uniref:IS481 family transposase n=1 Tax=Pseudovibrio sp. Ad37 TaxID=989422 RepID=UPI001FCB6339|nr:IS481 family transposase [Pseudovibrio sp. Ad37]
MPAEALLDLRRRLDQLPPRHPERKSIIEGAIQFYGLSRASVYRALQGQLRPQGVRRADHGAPRKIPRGEMVRYCEIIAALKIRTSNKKGRHVSTARAIELLETTGVETPQGLVQVPKSLLNKVTVNRYLRLWGYDHTRMTRAPAAVRFEAKSSNALWQFDISPSDLKEIEQPTWIDPHRKGTPTLMLFSVVDDRSGASYQEYRCVYGEDVESGLRFLFNAMAPKDRDGPALQGIPETLYLDNGPIAKSGIFATVMERLGVLVMPHMPAGSDGRRTTARSKGKVERPFRTVKEAHETLYHFHKPTTEAEANSWLARFIDRYNAQPHRREPHSRIEDWVKNLPDAGIRQMCSWERFCTFAREPETRKVAGDARIQVGGAFYEVDPDLAGESVTLWWGLFDNELFVEFGTKRFGPYKPSGGPIPLHRYRKPRKTASQKRADRIGTLAENISVPKAALTGMEDDELFHENVVQLHSQPFVDPDPYGQLAYSNRLDALKGISEMLQKPLSRLSQDDLAFVNALVERTLDKALIKNDISARFSFVRLRSSKEIPEC